MSKTEDFLKTAFAGESQTNRRYLAFALQAEAEGFPGRPGCSCPRPKRKRFMPLTI